MLPKPAACSRLLTRGRVAIPSTCFGSYSSTNLRPWPQIFQQVEDVLPQANHGALEGKPTKRQSGTRKKQETCLKLFPVLLLLPWFLFKNWDTTRTLFSSSTPVFLGRIKHCSFHCHSKVFPSQAKGQVLLSSLFSCFLVPFSWVIFLLNMVDHPKRVLLCPSLSTAKTPNILIWLCPLKNGAFYLFIYLFIFGGDARKNGLLQTGITPEDPFSRGSLKVGRGTLGCSSTESPSLPG